MDFGDLTAEALSTFATLIRASSSSFLTCNWISTPINSLQLPVLPDAAYAVDAAFWNQ